MAHQAHHILEAKSLQKVYDSGAARLVVLKDVSLQSVPNAVTTIVGASGAGKSTLLHIMGALDRPTSGEVSYDGRDLYSLSDRARAAIRNKDFGFVFQFYHLMPEFTALENVLLPSMVGRAASNGTRAWARDLLSAVGLSERAHHFPNQLSGGEQQRVAIARALVNKPRVLFADEPTGNLDCANSEQVMNLLLALQKQLSFTLIIVTHDPDIASCGSVRMRLKDGILVPPHSSN